MIQEKFRKTLGKAAGKRGLTAIFGSPGKAPGAKGAASKGDGGKPKGKELKQDEAAVMIQEKLGRAGGNRGLTAMFKETAKGEGKAKGDGNCRVKQPRANDPCQALANRVRL